MLLLTLSTSEAKSELDFYLEEHVLPKAIDFDIMNWWQSTKAKYLMLALIARDILVIPIFIVALEKYQPFSMGGRLITCHITRLKPNKIEAVICCHDWIHAEEGRRGF